MDSSHRRFLNLLAVLLVLAAFSFTVGLHLGATRRVRNSGAPTLARRVLTSVQAGRPAAAAEDSDLKTVETLWEVLDDLKKHYVSPSLDQAKLTDGAIRGMLQALGDKYTRYMDPREYREFQLQNAGEFDGIGATLRMVVDEKTKEESLVIFAPLDNSPAKKAGVRAGDKIIKIDGKSTKGMSLDDAVSLIRGPRGTKVVLTLVRKGKEKPFEVEIVRQHIELPTVTHKMVEPGIGHIWITQFTSKTEELLDQALSDLKKQGLKALIVDVRDDPGGLLDAAVGVASRFIEKGLIVITRGRDGEERMKAEPGKYANLKVPLCVLTNEGSASASEIFAGAVQDHHVGKIIGTTTYGKASVQVVVTLKNQGALAVTTAKYFTPAERDITATGIHPDIVVTMTPADREKKRDPQLQRAVKELKRLLAASSTRHSVTARRTRH